MRGLGESTILDYFGFPLPGASGSGETEFEGDALPGGALQTGAAGSGEVGGYQSVGLPAAAGVSAWLAQNKTAVYIGAGVLVAMAIFGGKRR